MLSVKAGTYYLTATINLTTADSGLTIEGTGGDVCDMKQAKYDVPKLGVAYMAPVSAANDAGLGAVIALVVAAVLAMLQ